MTLIFLAYAWVHLTGLSAAPANAGNILEICQHLHQEILQEDTSNQIYIQNKETILQKLRGIFQLIHNQAQVRGCRALQWPFGDTLPEECGQIEKEIYQLQWQMQQLQDAIAERFYQRDKLVGEYIARCAPQRPTASQEELEFLSRFSDHLVRAPFNRPPDYPPDNFPPDYFEGESQTNTNEGNNSANAVTVAPGNQLICVRTCDGGFFPLNLSRRNVDAPYLKQMCQALCPNVATALYTLKLGETIDKARSWEGEPYMALPKALRYQKEFDSACTCKPPHKNWQEALREAENLLSEKQGPKYESLTPEQADALSRPSSPALKTPNSNNSPSSKK